MESWQVLLAILTPIILVVAAERVVRCIGRNQCLQSSPCWHYHPEDIVIITWEIGPGSKLSRAVCKRCWREIPAPRAGDPMP